MAILLGKNAKTYWSDTLLNGDTVTAATASWVEIGNITDLSDNFSSEEVDVTTRETAGTSGFNQVVFTTKNGEITFGLLIKPDDAFTQALLAAWNTAAPIALLDLTGDKDVADNFGVAANWSVSLSLTKEVKGVQKADATLKIQEFGELVTTT